MKSVFNRSKFSDSQILCQNLRKIEKGKRSEELLRKQRNLHSLREFDCHI